SGNEVVRSAGAIELNGAEADAESAVRIHHDRHPSLSRSRIERRGWGAGDRRVQVEVEPAEAERHREVRTVDQRPLSLSRERNDSLLRRLRREGEGLRRVDLLHL